MREKLRTRKTLTFIQLLRTKSPMVRQKISEKSRQYKKMDRKEQLGLSNCYKISSRAINFIFQNEPILDVLL